MKIYNTLSRKVEEFIPHNKDMVTMYTCGPTVYHYAHIGNLRTYIFNDVLEKSLKYLGYNVKRVMNITDVGHLSSDADTGDDKMVKGAIREGKTAQEIARFYTDEFFKDCDHLNITIPLDVIPATDHILEFIKVIEDLIDKGYAYLSGGNVYFDTSKLDNYYALTNHDEDELNIGSRDDVEVDANKRNKTDFVLWFTKSKFQDQEQKWDSPWGVGYPGWHIECSCLASKYLGEYLDIHTGGEDLIFPHHTNEIAQSEAYLGHKWCNYWMHGGFLNDQSGKMSKSKGEFLTVSLIMSKGYNPLSYRYFCLGSRYRNQLVFSYESLDIAQNAYFKLREKTSKLEDTGEIDSDIYNSYINKFKSAIENDLNTSNMLTVLYDVLKLSVSDKTKKELIKSFDEVLSLDLLISFEKEVDSNIDEENVLNKIKKRDIAKSNKDYALADQIRDELLSLGIKLIDSREGTTFEKI